MYLVNNSKSSLCSQSADPENQALTGGADLHRFSVKEKVSSYSETFVTLEYKSGCKMWLKIGRHYLENSHNHFSF